MQPIGLCGIASSVQFLFNLRLASRIIAYHDCTYADMRIFQRPNQNLRHHFDLAWPKDICWDIAVRMTDAGHLAALSTIQAFPDRITLPIALASMALPVRSGCFWGEVRTLYQPNSTVNLRASEGTIP